MGSESATTEECGVAYLLETTTLERNRRPKERPSKVIPHCET